jgi:(p)ppGpp synthase/HD superfamily hydrolase
LLSWRFNLAFQLASGLHHRQTRKGTPVPDIAHLMAVCALVLEAGGDEDQAIAALLHDAVEDQGGSRR